MQQRFLLILLVFLLAACNPKTKNVCGYWKMEEVEINGLKLPFEQIGEPFYSFNANGDYSLVMNNQKETGSYTIENDKIILTSSIVNKPKQELQIKEQDSITVNLISLSLKNKMNIKLVKQKANSKEAA